MNDHDEKDLLTPRAARPLRRTCGGHPLGLDHVRGRARRIQRRRNAVAGAVAAVVLAVAVPTALSVTDATRTQRSAGPADQPSPRSPRRTDPAARRDRSRSPSRTCRAARTRAVSYVLNAEKHAGHPGRAGGPAGGVLADHAVPRRLAGRSPAGRTASRTSSSTPTWTSSGPPSAGRARAQRGRHAGCLRPSATSTSPAAPWWSTRRASPATSGSRSAGTHRGSHGHPGRLPRQRHRGLLDRGRRGVPRDGRRRPAAPSRSRGSWGIAAASEANGLVAGMVSYDDMEGAGCYGVMDPAVSTTETVLGRPATTRCSVQPRRPVRDRRPRRTSTATVASGLAILDAASGDPVVEFSPDREAHGHRGQQGRLGGRRTRCWRSSWRATRPGWCARSSTAGSRRSPTPSDRDGPAALVRGSPALLSPVAQRLPLRVLPLRLPVTPPRW